MLRKCLGFGSNPAELITRSEVSDDLRHSAAIRSLGVMALHEIKAEIPAGAADTVDELLLELGEGGWSVLEDAIAKRAWIVGIFSSEEELQTHWTELAAKLPVEALAEPGRRTLADEDWRNSYKTHFHAWRFGRLHWVPVWERATFGLPAGEAVLWLDPGLAFGTGNH